MSAQLENGYIRIANEIWDEVIRRDFSKRQKDILHLILRLSYGCQKKVAHIPMLKDFAICGVTPNHISNEVAYLKECKVIEWDREDMIFAFNKNYDVWQVSPVRSWNKERFKELIHLNLNSTTSQNRNFPKQELPETGSFDFPKKEVNEPEIPYGSKDEGVSKDSIKDLKDTTTTTSETDTLEKAHMKVFGRTIIPSMMTDFISKVKKKGYTEHFLIELLLEAGESSTTTPNIRYLESIFTNWDEKKIYTRVQAKADRDKEKVMQFPRTGQASYQKVEKKEREVPLYVRPGG
jgi:phage replication O-like protein O